MGRMKAGGSREAKCFVHVWDDRFIPIGSVPFWLATHLSRCQLRICIAMRTLLSSMQQGPVAVCGYAEIDGVNTQ